MINTMLDLETWSTQTNAAIRSIGACVFDENGIREKFYRNIDDNSYSGLHIDPNTVAWWSAQAREAQEALRIDCWSLDHVLSELAAWLPISSLSLIWGNGTDFDNTILANAYNHLDLPIPWKFYNNRCYRTIKNLFPIAPLVRAGTHHNALDDAVSQAEHLIAIRNRLFSWSVVDEKMDVSPIDLFNPYYVIY